MGVMATWPKTAVVFGSLIMDGIFGWCFPFTFYSPLGMIFGKASNHPLDLCLHLITAFQQKLTMVKQDL